MIFDYGKKGLEIKLDPSWNVTIFRPKRQKVIKNPIKEIKKSIKNPIGCPPLEEIIQNKIKLDKVCIVVSDATRPVPSHFILGALIEELNLYGIQDNQIKFLFATGLHRPSCENEIERILGKDLKNRINVIDHLATDNDSVKNLGSTSNKTPIFINKYYYESDLKILTGYVEPHFFFGFSGGRKSIVPGIVGEETIQVNHSAQNIASPYARFGVYKENPMHKNAMEIANLVGVDFLINVCINEKHEIVQLASGDFAEAHERLVEYQKMHTFREISELYDIVICGIGGYPLDLNLYQAVKSMAIGEIAVKNNGTIISVNECADGIGIGQEYFKKLIFSRMQPHEIYRKILNEEIIVPDQWEIQILARILMKADIFIISKLNENEIGNIGMKYAKTVEEAINKCLNKHGRDSSILILPNGPQILSIIK